MYNKQTESSSHHSSTKKIFKGASVYAISDVIVRSGTVLFIPFLANFLTPAEFGIIGILDPLNILITFVFVFGFNVSQTRIYMDLKDKPKELGSLFFTLNIFLYVVVAAIFIFFLTPPGIFLLNLLIHSDEIPFFPYIVIVLVLGFTNIFVLMGKSFYQIEHKYKRIGLSSVINFIIFALLSAAFIIFFKIGVSGYFLARLIAQVFLLVVMYFFYLKKIMFKFDFKLLKESLIIGFPFIIDAIFDNLINYSDRIILLQYYSLTVIGIYSLAYKAAQIFSIATLSFNNSWLPFFYKLAKSGQKKDFSYISRIFLSFVIGIGFICLAVQLFCEEIVIILPKEYSAVIEYFPTLLIAFFFLGYATLWGNIIKYHKDTLAIPIINIVATVFNIVLNIVFIPLYGPYFAAISTVIGYTIMLFLNIAFVKIKYHEYSIEFKNLLIVILFLISAAVAMKYRAVFGNYIYIIKFGAVSIFAAIYFNKIKQFLRILFKKPEKKEVS